jgi:hypothetical protein
VQTKNAQRRVFWWYCKKKCPMVSCQKKEYVCSYLKRVLSTGFQLNPEFNGMSNNVPEKYGVRFNCTSERQADLLEGVWTAEFCIMYIRARLGIEPATFNEPGDVRYRTDDPAVFATLLSLALTYAPGGWIVIKPMPPGYSVFHLPPRGHQTSDF